MTPVGRHRQLVLLILAAIAACAPLLLFPVGGDIIFHQVLIECYADAFWQGVLYPRWCVDGDAGLGSPVFLFYFPLAYAVTSLFYPLTHLGITLSQLYALGCMLAGLLASFTAYRWLRGMATPWPAAIGAVLYIYLPYRMEVMLYRAAYAELWGLAILPLVFACWRELAQQRRGALWRLGVAQALLILTHAPLAFAAGVAGGVYLIATSKRRLWDLKCYAESAVVALALSAFYIVPALRFAPFIAPEQMDRASGWANRFLSLVNLTEHHQYRLVAIIGVMLLATLLLAAWCWRKRARVELPFAVRELSAWVGIFALSLFLLFPLSAPLWNLVSFVHSVAFPWRMQALMGGAFVFFAVFHMQFLASDRQRRTAAGDAAGAIALLALISFFLLSVRDDAAEPMVTRSVQLQMHGAEEYQTRWVKPDFAPTVMETDRLHALAEMPRVEVASGSAIVSPGQWDARKITLKVHAFNDSLIRLRQRYFPIWRAEEKNGAEIRLHPEAQSGWLIFPVKAGEYAIALSPRATQSPWNAAAYLLSALTGLGLIAATAKRILTNRAVRVKPSPK